MTGSNEWRHPTPDLYITERGSGSTTLIVIHGGPDWDHSYIEPYVTPLQDMCRVLSFDMRGCGRSGRAQSPEGYHVDYVVDDLVVLMDARGISHGVLLGFSFGGRVALRFLQRHPERVKALILASTTAYQDFQPELDAWEERRERYGACREKADRITASPTLSAAEKARALAFDCLPLDVYDLSHIEPIKTALSAVRFSGEWTKRWLGGHRISPDDVDYETVIKLSGVPCLIIHGAKDMRFPVAVAERLHRTLPHSRLVILEQTGHLAHMEAPERWLLPVREFIDGL
ncbi:alpha/beta fold hydrolase [Mesorhizobium waimense]|nr:alpha/beta hydrolase [Mesorhizobium waimense]